MEQNNQSAAPAEQKVEQQEAAPQVEAKEQTSEEGAKEAAKEAAEEIKRINKLKLKIDDQEIEEELPFDIEENPEVVEYLKKNLQLSKVAQKRMKEKADFESKVNAFLEMLENDPATVLASAGKDPEQWAVEYLQNKLKEAEMSPEERERQQLKKELEAIKAEREAEKKAQEEKELALMKEKAEQYYEQTILEALDKAGVPKTAKMVANMAQYMYMAAERGSTLDTATLASMVKEDFIREMKEYVKVAPDEFIEDLVGKDRINSARKKAVQAVKKAAESVPTKITATGESSKQDVNKKSEKGTIKVSDFLRGV